MNLLFDMNAVEQKQMGLFCIPYGGGWSTTFRLWEKYIDNNIALIPVSFPGRGERFTEDSYRNMKELVTDACCEIRKISNIPIAFYGGCFGGLCAYEIINALEAEGVDNIKALFLHSIAAPSRITHKKMIHQLNKESFIEELIATDALPENIVQDETVLDMLLPGIRADYEIYESYQSQYTRNLKTPITIFYGLSQGIDMREQEWKKVTEKKCYFLGINENKLFEKSAQILIAQALNTELIKLL